MAHLSIRSLDDQALAALKRRAAEQNTSLNAVVLHLIDQGLGRAPARSSLRRHDDLDGLAGTWSAQDGAAFAQATAAFGEVDAALWK